MPTKIFKAKGGECPFGRSCEIDTPVCRKCENYQIATSRLFFWCKLEAESEPKQVEEEPKKPWRFRRFAQKGGYYRTKKKR